VAMPVRLPAHDDLHGSRRAGKSVRHLQRNRRRRRRCRTPPWRRGDHVDRAPTGAGGPRRPAEHRCRLARVGVPMPQHSPEPSDAVRWRTCAGSMAPTGPTRSCTTSLSIPLATPWTLPSRSSPAQRTRPGDSIRMSVDRGRQDGRYCTVRYRRRKALAEGLRSPQGGAGARALAGPMASVADRGLPSRGGARRRTMTTPREVHWVRDNPEPNGGGGSAQCLDVYT
jgi:hypothetical protein